MASLQVEWFELSSWSSSIKDTDYVSYNLYSYHKKLAFESNLNCQTS